MSWLNELKPEIKLTSPSGSVFTALWRNDERSVEKKLGMFNPPKFSGTIVQDLDVRSFMYPITFYFDGINHNQTADDFFDTIKLDPGQWEVVHPVKGPLILQLISAREVIAPISNGAYTEIESQWIEPANIERLISPSELAGSIVAQTLNAVQDALTTLAQIRADAYSAIQAAVNGFTAVAGLLDSIIKNITSTVAIAQDAYESARTAFNAAITAFTIDDPDSDDVGTALYGMISAGVDSSADFGLRFTTYEDLITDIVQELPDGTTADDYNKVTSIEFSITAALIAIAEVVATSTYTSRVEVVTAIDNITQIFNSAVEELEAVQDHFINLDIDQQYYSQTVSYTALVQLYTLCLQYLIAQFYNLRAEKRFTLKKARSPLEITVTEYGTLGEADENYDLFLNSNNLTGNDILILPAGREVVVYV
jgi:hypothetical protein